MTRREDETEPLTLDRREMLKTFGPGCLRNIIANQLNTIRHRQAGELLPGPGHHLRHVLAHGLDAQRRGAA